MQLVKNDTGQPDEAALLADIQGNILRGFNRARAVYLFVRFGSDAKAWIRKNVLGPDSPFTVSTATLRDDDSNLVNFFISADGLKALGRTDLSQFDPSFALGAHAEETLEKLNDDPKQWDARYSEPWHAAILVACKAATLDSVRAGLQAAGAECAAHHVEIGSALGATGIPLNDTAIGGSARYEPFGYRDALSHLYFFQDSANKEPPNAKWSSQRAASLVLKPDPLSPRGFGSYFVFRKLKQDVTAFEKKVEEATTKLLTKNEKGVTWGRFLHELYKSKAQPAFEIFLEDAPSRDSVKAFVKARIMGRSPDGQALTRVPEPPVQAGGSPLNHHFDFSDDRAAQLCPFHAHTRVMNPRGETGDAEEEKTRSLPRRGDPLLGW